MKKAFTLVELLIVIIIIGILATLAIPQYQRMVNRSRWSEAMSLADAIKTAENLYSAEVGGGFYTGAGTNLNGLSTLDLPATTARQFRFSLRNTNTIYAYYLTRHGGADDSALTAGYPYFIVNLVTNATSYEGNPSAPNSL